MQQTMSDKRFEYDDELLLACARSQLAAFVAQEDDNSRRSVPVDGDDTACTLLHEQHAKHYSRQAPVPFTKHKNTNQNGDHRYVVDERLRRFLQSVLYVQNHSSQTTTTCATGEGSQRNLHRITLNQFADKDATAWLLSQHNTANNEQDLEMEGGPWNTMLNYESLDTEWILDPVDIPANLTIGHGGTEHLNHPTKKARKRTVQDVIAGKITFPKRESDPNFAVPLVDDPDYDGLLLKVKPRRKLLKDLEKHRGRRRGDEEYDTYLNWATHDNPDGVPIVHDPIDQVSLSSSHHLSC